MHSFSLNEILEIHQIAQKWTNKKKLRQITNEFFAEINTNKIETQQCCKATKST